MKKMLSIFVIIMTMSSSGCMSTLFTALIVPSRGTKIPMDGWVAVPHGWPAPTAPVVLRSAVNLGNIKTAYPNVNAGQTVGLYDWYPVDFGDVRIQDSRWSLILTPGPYYNEWIARVEATTTNTNGSESFTYDFRFFKDAASRDCFATRINAGMTIAEASVVFAPTSSCTSYNYSMAEIQTD